jgi:hypothetical protein
MLPNFNKKFREITGIQGQIISTVDHVYASMPIRLIDSHHILHKMDDVKIIIWDDIYPSLKKYRSELIVDCGILAAKKEDYFLFPPNEIYGTSQVIKPAFKEQMKELETCLDLVLNVPSYKKKLLKEKYLSRFENLIEIYQRILSQYQYNSSVFYKNLVIEIYKFLGFRHLAEFYKNSAESLMSTKVINEYLPWLLEETQSEPFGLRNLTSKSALFKQPYFRYVNSSDTINELETSQQFKSVVELLRSGELLPSKEIMYWLFAISGIKHFGRDFGFFNKLSEYFSSILKIKNDFSDLQLTLDKNDGAFYIQFERDNSYQLNFFEGKWKARRYSIPRKNTDISTIPSIYLHIGSRFKEIYEEYKKTKRVLYIKMGEIL